MDKIKEWANNHLWTIDQLNKLRDQKYYGQVVVHFENGLISRINKNESLKPPKFSKN